MKRLLCVTLAALAISASLQAKEFNYIAVYKNPTKLVGFAEISGFPKGEWSVPGLVTAPGVKVDQKTINGKSIESNINLDKGKNLAENTDYSVTELQTENGERVYQVCINKKFFPVNYKPTARGRWGFKNFAEFKQEDDMYCFTLKNNKGYTKQKIAEELTQP